MITRKVKVGAAAAILVFVGLPAASKADWKICNRTVENVFVAVAYVNPGAPGFISEGWWELRACGGCETVMLSRETSDHGNLFFHAQGKSQVFPGGNRFCTRKGAFKIFDDRRRSCEQHGATATMFQHVTSKVKGGGTHTTDLTGRVAGKRCID